MKSEFQIFCDYKRAVDKANLLIRIASNMDDIAQEKMVNQTNRLSKYWSGEGKDIFTDKMRLTADDISETAKSLRSVANTIQTIAQQNYTAEMKALETIRTNTTK
ncbi:MAG: hypothetical protein IJO20_03195 [Ruminococcus sp.]|nr:hypothetical protein [Ruminococcus sp.]